MTSNLKEYTGHFYLSAGECNPQGEMPLPLLINRLIEVATMHANLWGVGFERLISENQGWVLSRVTVEMTRYPHVNEDYTVTTWIEDYNRHFSQRNMEICDAQGNTLGFARTIWVVINFKTRESVDISQLSYISDNVTDHPCPIAPQGRLKPFEPTREEKLKFAYTDIDFNGHVNTVRYIEHIMNCFDMETYNSSLLKRMEIAFTKESLYGQEASLLINDSDPHDARVNIDIDNVTHVKSRLVFEPRR